MIDVKKAVESAFSYLTFVYSVNDKKIYYLRSTK